MRDSPRESPSSRSLPGCGTVNFLKKMLRVSRISVFLCQAVIQLLLLLAGDVEQNPGPPKVLKQGGPTTTTSTQLIELGLSKVFAVMGRY